MCITRQYYCHALQWYYMTCFHQVHVCSVVNQVVLRLVTSAESLQVTITSWDIVDLCTSKYLIDPVNRNTPQPRSLTSSIINHEKSTSDDFNNWYPAPSTVGAWSRKWYSSQILDQKPSFKGHHEFKDMVAAVAGKHSKDFWHHKVVTYVPSVFMWKWYFVKTDYISPPCYMTKGWVPRQPLNWYITVQHCFIQNITCTYGLFPVPASFPSLTGNTISTKTL